MMKKILTITVPIYNVEKYLKRCLDSILVDEILNDIEVILVNDGSKDNSLKIMNEYKKMYPNTIVIVDKENGGHGSTINVGIEKATGKYFRVIDSDDWVNTIDFIDYVKKLKKEDADLVVTNYSQEHIYNNFSQKFIYKNLENNKKYVFDNIDLEILNGEYFVMATSTYKTSIIRESKLKMLEKTFYVDMQYNFIAFMPVKTFVYYDLDIYRYFIGREDQSMNTKSFVKNQNYHEKVMKLLVDTYTENLNIFSKNKKKYYKLMLYYMLYTHYTIYCVYDLDYKNAYSKIKSFDQYLKNSNSELYQKINISFIKAHRKLHFVFLRINGKFFNKMVNFLSLLKRR